MGPSCRSGLFIIDIVEDITHIVWIPLVVVGICGRPQVCQNCECVHFIIDIVRDTIYVVEKTIQIVWVPFRVLYVVVNHQMSGVLDGALVDCGGSPGGLGV